MKLQFKLKHWYYLLCASGLVPIALFHIMGVVLKTGTLSITAHELFLYLALFSPYALLMYAIYYSSIVSNMVSTNKQLAWMGGSIGIIVPMLAFWISAYSYLDFVLNGAGGLAILVPIVLSIVFITGPIGYVLGGFIGARLDKH